MEFEVSYALESEQQFWEELDEILSADCQSHELIDNSLRNYLSLTKNYKGEYLQSEYDIAKCSYQLLDSSLFVKHKEYVRRQIIHCLLQEDDPNELHLIAAFLLFDGKQNEATLEWMDEEECFPRLLELIRLAQTQDAGLHRILLQLMYEMSRIQRIRPQELMLIEDDFIMDLLQITETLSDDVADPYHYPVIRVLLVLSEQYMVTAHDPSPSHTAVSMPNRVIRALASHGASFKTFGENIILLLNRESETSLQLLILKLLYLLFTTPATYEYFYTNDLRVLVDVVIRNLLDLPHAAAALRHTYLRVLHPLLAHTQLADPDNHYKRDELLKVLHMITGQGQAAGFVVHFGATDDTTRRLGARCAGVPWLKAAADDDEAAAGDGAPEPERPQRPKYLGIGGNDSAAQSSLSVVAVAAPKAKPGVQTPSLHKNGDGALRNGGDDADLGPIREAQIGVTVTPY